MKRVLIIGYHFAATTMGGIRLQRIARYLPRFGWEAVVMAPPLEPAVVGPSTQGIRHEVVAGTDLTQIYERLKGRKPNESGSSSGSAQPKAKRIGLTSKINRWLMVPDKQVPWYCPAVRRGRELLKQEKFDAIFASLDPRTCLLVATRLSRETGIPAVLEYRDLWVGNPYYHITQPTPLHRWIHASLERKVLARAERVSAVCKGIADYLSKEHASRLKAPVELNYNFFDPGEYPQKSTHSGPRRPFTVSYTGALYASRTPQAFFEGLRLFLDRERLTPEQLRFRWSGPIAGINDLEQMLDRTAVRPYVDFLGQVPHRKALQHLCDSEAALLIQSPDDAIHIPGKLFEAMGARVPLLALAHPCEVTQIIERCRAGVVCPHTAESVAAGLKQFYLLWQSEKPWEYAEAEVDRFSASAAVGRLSALFDKAVVKR